MLNRTFLASAFVAAGLFASPASAGEWSGFYIGLHTGGAWGDVDTTTLSHTDNGFWEVPTGGSFNVDLDGVLGGAQIGYNFEMTGWVWGIELTGAGMDFDETIALTSDDVYSVESEWLATAALRAGFLVRPTSLLYVKGGYAGADVKTSEVDVSGGFLGAFSTDETHHGWIAGAGFEEKISPSVSLGLEYNYIDLGNQDHSGAATTGGVVVNDIDVQLHTVTARLNYHFYTP